MADYYTTELFLNGKSVLTLATFNMITKSELVDRYEKEANQINQYEQYGMIRSHHNKNSVHVEQIQ